MLLPPGIRNHGNLCYTSSALHLLFNQEYFLKHLDLARKHHLPTCNECQQESRRQVCSCVISSLYDLRQKYLYQPKSSALSSADLFTSVTSVNSTFKPGEEQDAHEFLTFLFDLLLKNIPLQFANEFKQRTHIEMTQKVYCRRCNYTNHVIQQELYIEVRAQSSSTTLHGMMNKVFDEEYVGDVICPNSNKLGLHREILPTSTPRNLFLHVTKLNSGNEQPKMQIQDAFLSLKNKACYKLVGVIQHIALQLGGHYVCYFLDHDQGQWFYANDDKISPVTVSRVLQQDPFLLLYELCDETIPALSLPQCTQISSNQWFTDQIIQVYMEMIRYEAFRAGKKVFILGSQFMEKFESTGYTGVSRWYKKVNMLEQDLLL